jgi:uncharacterized protein with beta-barrel porin domain
LVLNNGTVAANTNGASGVVVNGDGNSVVNNNTVTAGGTQTIGIAVNGINNTIVNSSAGVLNVSGASALGIFSNGGNQIRNDGTVIVSGPSNPLALTVGIRNFTGDVVTNNGSILITSGGAVGVLATNGFQATTINSATGIINAAGANSIGIFADADALTRNNGTILATGAGSMGVAFQGTFSGGLSDPPTFINNGRIIATGPNAMSIFTSAFSTTLITNNGLIDGRIVFTGGGFGDFLINNGTIQISNGPFDQHFLNFGIFQQTASGVLALRVNSAGGSDSLLADTAILGGTLRAVVQPGIYGPITQYPSVVTTACGCINSFDLTISSSPFFTASSALNPNGFDIDLTLTRIGLGSVPGMTLNQQRVGNTLELQYSPTLNPNSAAGQLFSNLLAATSLSALDQLSGEGAAAVQNASFQAGSMFNNAPLNQLVFGEGAGATSIIVPPMQYAGTPKPRGHEAFAAFKAPAKPPIAQTGRWRIWTLGFGGYRSVDGEAFPTGSANQSMRTYGGALGADYQLSPGLLLGFAAGGSDSSISVPDRGTTGNVTAGHFGLYGLKTWGSYYAAASASYARLANSTTRTIAGVGPTETATGRFDSDQLSGRLELGWKRAFASFNLTPFVAIEPAVLWTRGYTETSTIAGGGAGILGLTFASRTTMSLPTFVGLQADARMVLPNGAVVMPYGRLSWVHEFEPARQINATFISVPGASFTVDGARPASDAARLDAGAKVTLDAKRSVFANLSGEWSGSSESYTAMAGVKLVP